MSRNKLGKDLGTNENLKKSVVPSEIQGKALGPNEILRRP